MLDQAVNRTAVVTVGDVRNGRQPLSARVTVISKVGHKFPSGVGFRRAFLQFSVLDVNNKVLWSSGRTNGAGVIVDDETTQADRRASCGGRRTARRAIEPEKRIHQPHYQEITRQDQAQIYQELVSTPANVDDAGVRAGREAGRPAHHQLPVDLRQGEGQPHPAAGLPQARRPHRRSRRRSAPTTRWRRKPGPTRTSATIRTISAAAATRSIYRVPLAELAGKPAAVQATLYYQPTPPFYLQDRFCTSNSKDTKRLYYVAGKLDLVGHAAQDWKLRVVTSGPVTVP